MMNPAHLADVVETCINEGRHLTKWEQGFLESLSERLENGRTLSEREEEILLTIHREKADG